MLKPAEDLDGAILFQNAATDECIVVSTNGEDRVYARQGVRIEVDVVARGGIEARLGLSLQD